MLQIIKEVFPELEISYTFTPQALIKNLAEEKCIERKDGTMETAFIWVQDECTIFFDQLKRAEYMASTDGLLSKFYDGDTFTDSTISRGTKKVINPYCTAFLASTPILPKSFTEKLFMQGLLNRFLFILELKTDFRDERLAGTLTETEHQERLEITDWFDVLNSIVLPTTLMFKPTARKIYSEFSRKIDNIINDDHNLGLRESYFGNLHNYLKRLSAVYQIAELNEEELLNIDGIMYITENSVLWAIKYLEKAWKDFNEAFKISQKLVVNKPAVYHKSALQEIMDKATLILKRYNKSPETYGIKKISDKPIIKLSHLRNGCSGLENFDTHYQELIKLGHLKQHDNFYFSQRPTIGVEILKKEEEGI